MKVELYESRHLREAGFFRFIFRALQRYEGAVVIGEERPVRRDPNRKRGHEGACLQVDRVRLFIDMSDHVFDFDFGGLEWAEIYLKANLNRELAVRVLAENGREGDIPKLRPFSFFAPTLGKSHLYRRVFGLPGVRDWIRRRHATHVVGVYENPYLEGIEPLAGIGDGRLGPSGIHFAIRDAFSKELMGRSDLSVFTRLTSRGKHEIEDYRNVYPNLNHWRFLWQILTSDILVLNTFPHALYPWKVFEAMAMGKPFVVERSALVQMPEPFAPIAGIHFLEVLPGFGSFDPLVPLDDPASYRVLEFPPIGAIREGVANIAGVLTDRKRVQAMQAACREFARNRLNPRFVARWIVEEAGRQASG